MSILHELIHEAEKLDVARMADEKRRLRIQLLLTQLENL